MASWLCAMDQLVWWSFLARVRLRFQIHLPRRRPAAGDHARTGNSSATADRSGDGNQSDVATAAVRRRLHSSWYRARHSVFGSKSDAADAVMLANIVRTDAAAHRPLPADTDAALAIRALARAQQDAVWSRQRFQNYLLVMLRVRADGRKEIVALADGYRESTSVLGGPAVRLPPSQDVGPGAGGRGRRTGGLGRH